MLQMGIVVRSLREGGVVVLWTPIYVRGLVWKKTFLGFDYQLAEAGIILFVLFEEPCNEALAVSR